MTDSYGKNPSQFTGQQDWPETAATYAKWLESWPVDYFFTGTFRGVYSEDGARRALFRFFTRYDERQLRHAFLCIERGERYGRVHTHGLLCYNDRALFRSAQSIREDWEHAYGFATVETPMSRSNVCSYCSKYVTKHFETETYLIL